MYGQPPLSLNSSFGSRDDREYPHDVARRLADAQQVFLEPFLDVPKHAVVQRRTRPVPALRQGLQPMLLEHASVAGGIGAIDHAVNHVAAAGFRKGQHEVEKTHFTRARTV
jgi:hypothetical protein